MWIFLGILLVVSGCSMLIGFSPTPDPSVATPDASGWQMLASGLERRTYTPDDNPFGQLEVLRIDPAYYQFRVHYQPGDPNRVTDWRDQLSGVSAFINANFFDPDYRILGLLVADGVVYGSPYVNRGGMLTIQNGLPSVRSNTLQPYQGEPLEQAVQAFPMLVESGQSSYTASGADRVTRRTVAAQDSAGRILLMVTTGFGATLEAISTYLPTTDMDIIQAFNLDGGGSTLMYYQTATMTQPFLLPSLDAVPAVLAVYPRQ